jgi:monothiol glutaredoxin
MTTSSASIRSITAQELKSMLDSGVPLELWDVRTPAERNVTRIEGARLLDQEGAAHIESLDRDTPLVFHCPHGMRSQAAAQVDASVPRY